MSKKHAEYLTDEEIAAEIAQLAKDVKSGKISDDEAERNAYFTDPANAGEVAAMFARMKLVEELYKARQEAGLTQKEVADKLGTSRSYIAAVERGRKNITFATLTKYAAACGKKVVVTLL